MQETASGKRVLDTGTMTELFHRHAPALFAYFRQHIASREDAEDLLHEVFAAALEQSEFSLLNNSEQALWLWRVARNKTRRPTLALNYVASELVAGDEQSPEYAALRREEYARLLAALEQLASASTGSATAALHQRTALCGGSKGIGQT
jgi:RNA polymerase sigma-70 factor (ECF subfamily)